jgi:PAS domain S-box-containing protein
MSSVGAKLPLTSRPKSTLRLLIIDDDQSDRIAIKRCLQKADIAATVEEATSSVEALHLVRPNAYDCVFLDYHLPGEDGISVLHALQRLAPDVPVVVLTGQGDETLAVEFMKAGAGDYLPKSCLTPDRLSASLRHAVQVAKVSAAKRRAEEDLRQQEGLFRTLANAIPQLAWMTNAQGALQWCNKRWYDYTGTTFEDVKGERLRNIFHADEADRVLQNFRQCCISGEPYEDTFALRSSDGRYRRHLCQAVPWRREDGAIAGWFGTNTDIHDRVTTEETLRRSELLLAGQKTALELAMSGVHRDEVLGCIASKAKQQAGEGARVALFLVDAQTQHLQFAASAGMPAEYAHVVAALEIGPTTPSCGLVVYSGQPVITKDVFVDPLWTPYLGVARKHEIRSCWSFPISSFFGTVLGTLAVYHSTVRDPTRNEVDSLKLLCDTAALVIERHNADEGRKRAERELARNSERRRILSEALAQLLATDDPDKMARELFDTVASHLDVDTFLNFMVAESGKELLLHSYAGITEPQAGEMKTLQFGQGISGTVAATKEAIIATDIQHSDYDKAACVRGMGIQAYACNPLMSGTRVIGTLSFASHKRIKFDESELEFLRAISGYAALAMERARTTHALRQSEERFRSVFEQTTGGITQMDLTGRFMIVNDRYCEIAGRARDELLRLRMQDITHPDDLPRNLELFNALAEGRGPNFVIEKRNLRPDGSHVWVRNHVSAIRNAEGSVTSLAAASMDISEIKSAEAALKASEQQFMQLAESIPQLAWMADEKGWIFWYNRRWFEYTGTNLEDMQGWGWRKVHHPDHEERVVAGIQHSWDTGDPWQDTFPIRGSDGEYRWFFSQALPLRDEQGNILRWFGTNTDISELREAEEALRRAESIAATGRMAHGMAHEINNPLEAVTNVLYLMQNDAQTLPANLELLGMATEELNRVSRIVQQTLGLYANHITPQPTSVCPLIDGVVQLLQQRFPHKQVFIERRYDWTGEVVLNAAVLQQVFWNVLENAFDAVPTDAKIVIHVAEACAYHGKRRKGVRITVADNGPGMSAREMKKLFEAFYSTHPDRGRGLGLWAVRDIVTRQGGTIRVKSSTSQGKSGTVACIFFPFSVT